MEDNPFVRRAAELLAGTGDPVRIEERLLVQNRGIVPCSPQYHEAWIAFFLWERAGHGKHRPPSYLNNPDIVCAVCGDRNHLKGWCKKHYLIARRTKNAEAPFLSPAPSTGRIGRPRLGKAKEGLVTVRLSEEAGAALDTFRQKIPRSLVVETLVREALGLPPLLEATVDHA